MLQFKNAIKVIFFFFSVALTAQENNSFSIKGITQKADSKLQKIVTQGNAVITVYKDGEELITKKSDKTGAFQIENLPFNHTYKIVFAAVGCIDMFMLVDANIPADAKIKVPGIEANYIFYELKDKNTDKNKFNYPFLKAAFSAKAKGVVMDEKYNNDFVNGIIPPEMVKAFEKEKADKAKAEKAEAELKEKQIKEAQELAELEKKKIKIAGKIFTGENPSKPLSNVTLKLFNEKGEMVQTVKTNFLGAFVFYIQPDNNYNFTGESSTQVQSNSKVVFTNKNDHEVQSIAADAAGIFNFKIVGSDHSFITSIAVDHSDLKMDLKGKLLSNDGTINKPLAEIKINLMNPLSELVQTTKTDKEGSFAFTYLSSTDNYTIAIDENNPQLTGHKKIILADEKGAVIKEVDGNKITDFKFEILPDVKSKMSTLYVDDPWLNISAKSSLIGAKPYEQVITERVYFNVNDDKLLPDAKKTLDKIIIVLNSTPNISIVLSSHTDSQGADDYNLKLSERRAKAAVDYIIANGIAAARVTGKGFGETQLLNKCANNAQCSEVEHAQNRRLEFKVIKK